MTPSSGPMVMDFNQLGRPRIRKGKVPATIPRSMDTRRKNQIVSRLHGILFSPRRPESSEEEGLSPSIVSQSSQHYLSQTKCERFAPLNAVYAGASDPPMAARNTSSCAALRRI